jgi:hypothetical protein
VLSKRAPVLDDASLAQATDRDAHSRMGPPETRPGAKTKSLQIEYLWFAGLSKRLKGLEPSTFCMASRP